MNRCATGVSWDWAAVKSPTFPVLPTISSHCREQKSYTASAPGNMHQEYAMTHDSSTKLLIVDDLPENLRALNALIREHDRSIYQASSGEEALALLLEHDFR